MITNRRIDSIVQVNHESLPAKYDASGVHRYKTTISFIAWYTYTDFSSETVIKFTEIAFFDDFRWLSMNDDEFGDFHRSDSLESSIFIFTFTEDE